MEESILKNCWQKVGILSQVETDEINLDNASDRKHVNENTDEINENEIQH